MRRRAPRPAAAAIALARTRAAPLTPLAAAQAAWAGVVGDPVARVTEPTAERAGVLVVECRDAVWAQELDLMQAAVLARLREALGEDAPTALRFAVRREAGGVPDSPGWPTS